ncbi:putative F-box protein At5g55150 [Carex rostrata]
MRLCWADLPSDLLPSIAEKASTTNIQYINLRAICKAWRQALTPNPHHLPPQFPWLMLPQPGIFDAHVSFYDIVQSKTYRFQLPYMSGKYCCGTSHGWLVLEHEHRVSLFNPITSSCIDLPSLDAPPSLLRKGCVLSDKHEGYTNCIQKVCLSCTPSKLSCIVVAWFLSSSNWELGFCRLGDSHWTELKKWDAPSVMDFIFYNNLVYTVNTKNIISVYDLQDHSVWNFPSNINFYNIPVRINLVEGDADSSGPLIVRTSEYREKTTVYAYKWRDDRKIWDQVKDIENRVLFLNMRNSINLQCDEKQEYGAYYCPNMKLQKYPNNCDERQSLTMDSFRIGIYQYNLESGKVVRHKPGPIDVFRSICGLPLWVTPSLI